MAEQRNEQASGFRLSGTLTGHTANVLSLAFHPLGHLAVTASADSSVRVWDVNTQSMLHKFDFGGPFATSAAFSPDGRIIAAAAASGYLRFYTLNGVLLREIAAHEQSIRKVAFTPSGKFVATASKDGQVKLWDTEDGRLSMAIMAHSKGVLSVAFHPSGSRLVTASRDHTINVWCIDGSLVWTLAGHEQAVNSLALTPDGRILASAGGDRTIKLWDFETGKLFASLEAHTARIDAVAFSLDGTLLASRSSDGLICLWSVGSWEVLGAVAEPTQKDWWLPAFGFHPKLPLLGSVVGTPSKTKVSSATDVHLWHIDVLALQGEQPTGITRFRRVAHHTTAKVVLVGDSGVGKTGLGWRVAHGEFKEHSSTHGQQFWVVKELGIRRSDGTQCEAILWDLAGQPDYRLIHALFLDDADLALMLFDAADNRDPLRGVEFWLKQLKRPHRSFEESASTQKSAALILVAARCDRGTPTLSREELDEFCRGRGISGWIRTSAKEGEGINDLINRMKALIRWDEKPAIVTTDTFKRIKDYVLQLKESGDSSQTLVSPDELRRRLQTTDSSWSFTDDEMITAARHLETYGYVKWLRTSGGQRRILLAPDVLNNLAASFVLEARRDPHELGALDEKRLLTGDYNFREVQHFNESDRNTLLDAAALLFLEHNVAFRETDPLTNRSFLVFPELINLKKPILAGEKPTEDGAAYTVTGAVENVYASLVVLLGYTKTFTRRNQWQNQARYEVGEGLVCGFRLEGTREGELDFVLYFGKDVGEPIRRLFQSLFETFLARRNLTVSRFEPVRCTNRACTQPLERSVVRARVGEGKLFAFCNECGEKLTLPQAHEPIQLTRRLESEVDAQRRAADRRSRFEQVVFQIQTYVKEHSIDVPTCFISYAWGESDHERWVERMLAPDLQKAGIAVVLDKWENAKIGASVSRFVERIEQVDRILVVGTHLYRTKYENRDSANGYVVAAEVDVISNRLIGTEAAKQTVLPLLLAGEIPTSLPPLMHGRVYADFRNEQTYFSTMFELILSIYELPSTDPRVTQLRHALTSDLE